MRPLTGRFHPERRAEADGRLGGWQPLTHRAWLRFFGVRLGISEARARLGCGVPSNGPSPGSHSPFRRQCHASDTESNILRNSVVASGFRSFSAVASTVR